MTAVRPSVPQVGGDVGAGRGVGAGVGEQVRDGLVQAQRVADDDDGLVAARDRPLVVRARGGGLGDGLVDEPAQVDALVRDRAALVERGEQQQVVDEHAHARPGGLDALGRVPRRPRGRWRRRGA